MTDISADRNKRLERLHSFIVCAYGSSPFLRDCIESLEKQTLRSNIVITTSTPNESVMRLAEEFGLKIIINPNKEGIAEDWNFALRQAKTRLITLAHQDDVYEPSYAEHIVKAYRKKRRAVILFTDYRELRLREKADDSNCNEWQKCISHLIKIKHLMLSPLRLSFFQESKWIRRRILSLGNPICCPAVTYVKKELPERLFHGTMKSNIDWQAWEELSRKKGAFVFIPEPLMEHRIHENSTTAGLVNDHARREEDLYMYRRFWPGRIPELIWKFYGKNERYQ